VAGMRGTAHSTSLFFFLFVTVRERLADALRGVLVQRLLPRSKMRGRILASEVMIHGYATRELLRDPAKVKSLPAVPRRDRLTRQA
jgi:Tfp pilus assembly pilus retraction ATPase PilT